MKALVVSAGGQTLAIVTLDTLKYPADLADKARKHVERATRIPAGNVILCSSHTHSGPLWSFYEDKLATPIVKAVALALNDRTPCTMGVARGKVEGVSENRRVLIAGRAWNKWLLQPSERGRHAAAGPADPEINVLAVADANGRYKAILYNFACHAANTRRAAISADYPGHVQRYLDRRLGYEATALFLPGACGDVNPNYDNPSDLLGQALGKEILNSLRSIAYIAKPTLAVQTREIAMPARERPEFNEKEIALKWPGQLEHYRKSFEWMKRQERPAYEFPFTGIRIGDDLALVTNPCELFCEIGLCIKRDSPFTHTMVVEQTNGACGYVPTTKAFEQGGYETWYAEHSYLSVRSGELVKSESSAMLQRLRDRE